MFEIISYQNKYADELLMLFKNTVRFVNIENYSKSQVEAWGSDKIDLLAWSDLLAKNKPFMVLKSEQIIGYADLQNDGLIDHFFCHHQHQNQGVGSALMLHIFNEAKNRNIDMLYSHVSITAKCFFELFGFEIIEQNEVVIRGETLTNYLMHCQLKSC